MRAGVFAMIALGLSACERAQSGFPPEYEISFMHACEAQRPAAGVCGCTWAKIEAQVPRRDFEALERLDAAARAASPIQRRIQEFARACAAPPSP